MNHHRTRTLAVHAGTHPVPSDTHAKVSPIYASSVWTFDNLDQIDDVYAEKAPGFIYSRVANPGVVQLEEAVAVLEQGESAAAYSSGMAAIAVALLAEVSKGDHIVAHPILYGGTYALLKNELAKFGVTVTFVDCRDHAAVRKALTPATKILYVETIGNPLMEVMDIPELAAIAHSANVKLYVDNTFASPYHIQPLCCGADVVLHSATKYLNGHSDVTAGVFVSDREFIKKARGTGTLFGPTLSPFDAWLVLRGLKTLALRMQRHSENALDLASYLENHPKVTHVNYPGLAASPTHAIAAKLLTGGFGGMLSFTVQGGLNGARTVIDSLTMSQLVPSLAGPSTTTSHPGKTSHRAIPLADREPLGVGDGLIRVSVGIEDIQDIIADFAQALDRVHPDQ